MPNAIFVARAVGAAATIVLLGLAASADAQPCPGFGDWKLGGLEVSASGPQVVAMRKARAGCHDGADCDITDAAGVTYTINSSGAVMFKRRPVVANEQLPFGVTPGDTLEQTAKKVQARGGQGVAYGLTDRPKPVSVTVFCASDAPQFLFQFGFNDAGRMIDVEENALYANGRGLWVGDVTFHTGPIEP